MTRVRRVVNPGAEQRSGYLLRSALADLERLLAGPDVDRPMPGWDRVLHACRSTDRSDGAAVLREELLLAATVRSNGGDPWTPPPTLGTLLRLARLNVQAALRKAGEAEGGIRA